MVLGAVKASRPLQLAILVIVLLFGYFVLLRSPDEFTPEELNSLLQNKDETTVRIDKVELTSQTLKQPYLEAGALKPKDWDIKGTTLVKNNEYIRLTSDLQHQVGNMYNKFPIQAESFEMELTFHMHSKASNGMVGDGFAIWFTDEKSDIGDVFGSKNLFTGLGIMVDTYKNGKRGHFPFVNLMLGDGNSYYNKDSDGFETRLAGCTAKSVLNPSSGMTKARIIYIKDGYLSLDFKYNAPDGDWHNCVTLTDVKLPVIKYLGLTAETGDLSQAVDIIENKVFALYNPGDEGSFIESIDQLQSLMNEQAEEDKADLKRRGGKNRAFKKKTSSERRRSLKRLRNSERRIKERERKLRQAKYGDPESNAFTRFLSICVRLLKLVFYLVLIMLAIWVAYTVYRVQNQKRRSKGTGLLD